MEKSKKSKKKLIGIIAGCAMAFVLTVVVSVAVTLAYFGDSKTSSASNITMGQALKFTESGVTAAASSGTTLTNVLPGWSGSIDAKGTVEGTTTKYFLRFKFNSEAATSNPSGVSTDVIAIENVKYGSTELTAHSDGYYYLASDGKASVLNTTSDTEYTFVINFKVAEDVKNASAGASLDVTATIEIVQADYLVDGATADGTATVEAVATAWATANTGSKIG